MTDDEGRHEDVSVAITDDKTGTLTVTIKKLQMSDMGWYWCVAGPKQRTVHVQVLPRPSTSKSTASTDHTNCMEFLKTCAALSLICESSREFSQHLYQILSTVFMKGTIDTIYLLQQQQLKRWGKQ